VLGVEVEPGRFEEMVAAAVDGLPEELKNNLAGLSSPRLPVRGVGRGQIEQTVRPEPN
jgi:hypothetical protein